MSQPTVAMLDIDLIEIEQGFNPRKAFDDKAQKELVASIKASGIAQALTVRPNGGSHYVLVAGERRLRGARELGLKQVPVLIREKNQALALAVVENMIRADLNPIEQAEGLKRLSELENLTQKKLAARTGKSPAFISTKLGLLELPPMVQELIAKGFVPVDAAKVLRKIAQTSPAIAEAVCDLVAKGEFTGHQLLTNLDEIVLTLADSPEAPTMLDPVSIRISDAIEDKEVTAKLVERRKKAFSYENSNPVIRLDQAEVDAARAAGCLLELDFKAGEWATTLSYITDRELAADLIERTTDRHIKAENKRKKAVAKERAEQPGEAAKEDKERENQHREEEKLIAAATSFNDEVGRRLMRHRGAKRRPEHSLRRGKAVALALLDSSYGLAGSGLRLVLPQLREVGPQEGKKAPSITYANGQASTDYLKKRVDSATSAEQVLEILAEAMVAAVVADPSALGIGLHPLRWSSTSHEQIKELLEPELTAALPASSNGK